MLELAALGLLQQEPLHGYRLKQQLERFMGGCISVNYGTIYPLLKRLEERGLITVLVDNDGEAGSGRKIYSITELGCLQWKQHMLEHPHESWVNSRSRFLIKFFFFNYLDSIERIKLLKHRLMVCQLRLDSQDVRPEASDLYQTSVLQHCTNIIHNEIEWLRQQLQQEIQKHPEATPVPEIEAELIG